MNDLISPEAVQERQQAGQAQTIVDVRDPDEYVSGRLPGAVNIPYDELPQRLAEIPRDRPVVTY